MALTGANAYGGSSGDGLTGPGPEGGGLFEKKGSIDNRCVFYIERVRQKNGIAEF